MKKKITYSISEKEAQTIKNCLMYCRHRYLIHKKKDSLPKIKNINKLIKEFK